MRDVGSKRFRRRAFFPCTQTLNYSDRTAYKVPSSVAVVRLKSSGTHGFLSAEHPKRVQPSLRAEVYLALPCLIIHKLRFFSKRECFFPVLSRNNSTYSAKLYKKGGTLTAFFTFCTNIKHFYPQILIQLFTLYLCNKRFTVALNPYFRMNFIVLRNVAAMPKSFIYLQANPTSPLFSPPCKPKS